MLIGSATWQTSRFVENGSASTLGIFPIKRYRPCMGIGERVLERIGKLSPKVRHADVAAATGMTPDALSRSLSGERRFSVIELAEVADFLGADIHWLITGQEDPRRLLVAARHDFDHETGHRDVPGRESDERVLQDIALAYRQANPPPMGHQLPGSVGEVIEALGEGFVRPFADRLEERLAVDVVRVGDLSTAYSFTVAGRLVIAVGATGNWFWENWCMAHELGHLALGHVTRPITDNDEAAANQFAAQLLLPADALAAVKWDRVSDRDLAQAVWDRGVSVDALARRHNTLSGQVPEVVARWADYPTQRLLRRHLPVPSGVDLITERMTAASERRFPLHLREAHLDGIASGALGKGTLAWMLGVDADALEVDAPEVPEVGATELTVALGL